VVAFVVLRAQNADDAETEEPVAEGHALPEAA
jgi:hypothetical protein